jgi:hypothetical protein
MDGLGTWCLPWSIHELEPVHDTDHRVYFEAPIAKPANTVLVPANSLALSWKVDRRTGYVEASIGMGRRPLTKHVSVRKDMPHSFRYENYTHSVEPLMLAGMCKSRPLALHDPMLQLQQLEDDDDFKGMAALLGDLSDGRLVYARIEHY